MPSTAGLTIPPEFVEHVLLGSLDDRRQLQDSPILGDVWLAYAAEPAAAHDLLITPHKNTTAGVVAREIRLQRRRANSRDAADTGLAYLQGIVAVRLHFDEVLRILTPLTPWWQEQHISALLHASKAEIDALQRRMLELLTSAATRQPRSVPPAPGQDFSPRDRYIALAALILWARRQKRAAGREAPGVDEIVKRIDRAAVDVMLRELANVYADVAQPAPGDESHLLVFQIALNRPAHAALERSVPAVKGDAARTLFRVKCDGITWAVVDSGIDAGHDAFVADGKSRVRKTFDFTRIRDILSSDDGAVGERKLALLAEGVGLGKQEVRKRFARLRENADHGRPIDWDDVEKLIALRAPPPVTSPHGTHVAGIIGASGESSNGAGTRAHASGMCPDINLYDFRVLGRTVEDTEFAVIAALQYIRYINERHSYITIHGVNLSLSIPHSVRNYACGRTPICIECERLVESGVVVVAAAGNRGYHQFETREGIYEGYTAFSVTDPGNAESVLTVGATHGNWPHTYGVSFFSSRGPTGDGRPKPDLVAPGERIEAPFPDNQWRRESGTSMAAPHVSGAAAMLMARYAELIGQPRRIKRILCDSATDLGRERSFQGSGMLDVLRAFQAI